MNCIHQKEKNTKWKLKMLKNWKKTHSSSKAQTEKFRVFSNKHHSDLKAFSSFFFSFSAVADLRDTLRLERNSEKEIEWILKQRKWLKVYVWLDMKKV